MDWGDVIESTVGCAGFFGVPMLYMWTKHKQRMAELQSRFGLNDQNNTLQEMRKLQDEIARLRDTTTQYDMTVERTLIELKQRLAAIEAAGPTASLNPPSPRPSLPPAPAIEEPVQQIIQR